MSRVRMSCVSCHESEGEFAHAATQQRTPSLAISITQKRAGSDFAKCSLHLNLAHIYTELGELTEANRHLEEAWNYKEDDAARQTALFDYQARLDLARGRLWERGRVDRGCAEIGSGS